MALCDCNGRRIPTKWKVSISGISNGICPDCAAVNGDYYPERDGSSCTSFLVSVSIPGPCGQTQVSVTLTDSNGVYSITVNMSTYDNASYQISNVKDLLSGPLTLNKIGTQSACSWPSSITLTAIGPVVADLSAANAPGAKMATKRKAISRFIVGGPWRCRDR